MFVVENLAYKKDSWINKKTQYKRHIRHKLPEGHADRAVDGNLDVQLQSCTILDNLYGKYPLWTVDLGQKQRVSGVVIYTWQGDGQGRTFSPAHFNIKSLSHIDRYCWAYVYFRHCL